MYITYPELLQLKEMNQARVIAGDDGLYRLITWYSISEIVDYKTEDYDKKLVFIAGIGMTDYTKDLLKILHYVYDRGAAGVVLEIGPYIPEVPISIIKAADSMQFPLLTLPFDTKVSVVTYAMTQLLFSRTNYLQGVNAITSQLLKPDFSENTELSKRARFYGYKQENSYCVILVESDENNSEYSLQFLLLTIFEHFQKHNIKNWLWMQKDTQAYFLFPLSDTQQMQSEIVSVFPAAKPFAFSAGVGSVFSTLADANQSAAEAEEALHMIHQCHKKTEIRFFEDTGIYRLLFHFPDKTELQNISETILCDLIAYDLENQTCLVQTLENYLDCNCNVTATSDAMNVHRNTIKYRVKKIEELLDVNFLDYNQCFQLRLAYKIRKYGK